MSKWIPSQERSYHNLVCSSCNAVLSSQEGQDELKSNFFKGTPSSSQSDVKAESGHEKKHKKQV